MNCRVVMVMTFRTNAADGFSRLFLGQDDALTHLAAGCYLSGILKCPRCLGQDAQSHSVGVGLVE